jgi:hypothetical protein
MAATAETLWNLVARDVSEPPPLTPDPKTYTLTEPASPPGWIERIICELRELMTLPESWDSYGARKIARGPVDLAIEVLSDPMFACLPPPAIVPTSAGGVQAEWRVGSRALELEFLSDLDLDVLYFDEEDGVEEEVSLRVDFTALQSFARKLRG